MTDAPWILAMPALVALHTHGGRGVAWRLTPAGVQVGIATPERTSGPPASVRRVWSWYGGEIQAAAIAHEVPVELIVACICSEAAGGQTSLNKVTTALRHEPGYVSDEATPAKVSGGCMQMLLSTAREVGADSLLSIEDLFVPRTGINLGAAYIAQEGVKAGGTNFDPPLVAAAYNAGGLYADNVPANRWKLVCYPIGTGEYIDRSVLWFNDAMSLGGEVAGMAPSFARALAV